MSEAIHLRIRQIRKELDLTQEEFAARIDYPRSNYSQVETGKLGVSIVILANVAKEFGISTDWLITGQGEKYNKMLPKKPFDNGDFGESIVSRLREELQRERIEREREQAEKKALLEQNTRLLELLGKPSGESRQRIGYNILAYSYKHIRNNFGNTLLASCR